MQNWLSRLPNLSPPNYRARVCVCVLARKVNTSEELLLLLLSAARRINHAAVLRKVSTSLISRLVKYVHVNGGLFKQVREQ